MGILDDQEQTRLLNQRIAGHAHQESLNAENKVMAQTGMNRQQAQQEIKKQSQQEKPITAGDVTRLIQSELEKFKKTLSITGPSVTGGNGTWVISADPPSSTS